MTSVPFPNRTEHKPKLGKTFQSPCSCYKTMKQHLDLPVETKGRRCIWAQQGDSALKKSMPTQTTSAPHPASPRQTTTQSSQKASSEHGSFQHETGVYLEQTEDNCSSPRLTCSTEQNPFWLRCPMMLAQMWFMAGRRVSPARLKQRRYQTSITAALLILLQPIN